MEKKQQETTATPAKGLFAMFGASLPKTISTPSTLTAKIDPLTQAPSDNKRSTGGGAWRASTTRKERRATPLALQARKPGATISVTENRVSAQAIDDTDVTMSDMGGKGKARRKRFSPYGGRRVARQVERSQIEQRVDILIDGFAPGTEASVLSELQTKSKKKWEPLDVKVEHSRMLLTVNGLAIASAIVRLNGYVFGTNQLNVSLYHKDLPIVNLGEMRETTMDSLREFLRSRWNSETRFLNLEAMWDDKILKKAGIKPPGDPKASSVVGPAMMKLAGEMYQDVVTISFARNRLRNTQPISAITQFLPNVQNLSFEENVFTKYENLDPICGFGKLKNLRELVLLENPLRTSALRERNDGRSYIRNIVKRFPSIVLLDGSSVHVAEEERRPRNALPLETKLNFYDHDTSKATADDFLSKYFALFDENRQALQVLYDATALFSVSTQLRIRGTQKKTRGRQKQRMMDDDDKEVSWTEIGRNLAKTANTKQKGKHLFFGPDMITETLKRLPGTTHDLSMTQDFIVDAFMQPLGDQQALQVTMHGEFRESNKSSTLYSFDRTFILRPAFPDSPAMAAGWPYVILSDMLCVRDYCVLRHGDN